MALRHAGAFFLPGVKITRYPVTVTGEYAAENGHWETGKVGSIAIRLCRIAALKSGDFGIRASVRKRNFSSSEDRALRKNLLTSRSGVFSRAGFHIFGKNFPWR